MMLIRTLLLLTFLSRALAQAPSPVPPLPDTERRTQYSISGTTCACAVGFQIYGGSTDIQVWINGTRVLSTDPTFGWALTSPSGEFTTIPRPITDAIITFNQPQTGTVQIVGARRPRQTLEFEHGQTTAVRSVNQVLTDLIAQNRERWDKINDLTGRMILSQPGNALGPLPPPSQCANMLLSFDPSGRMPQCVFPIPLQIPPSASDLFPVVG